MGKITINEHTNILNSIKRSLNLKRGFIVEVDRIWEKVFIVQKENQTNYSLLKLEKVRNIKIGLWVYFVGEMVGTQNFIIGLLVDEIQGN